MHFTMAKSAQDFFSNIIASEGSHGSKEKNKFIQFDVYYCCALIGMAAVQLDDDSTMLSDEGIQTLNFYSQQGYHLIREFPLEEKPTSREEFLEAFNIAMQLYEKQDSEVN